MLFIFLLALIVLGPRKLPEVARQLGRIMGDIRRASNDFQSQIEDEVRRSRDFSAGFVNKDMC